jgi:hypothetical protein
LLLIGAQCLCYIAAFVQALRGWWQQPPLQLFHCILLHLLPAATALPPAVCLANVSAWVEGSWSSCHTVPSVLQLLAALVHMVIAAQMGTSGVCDIA